MECGAPPQLRVFPLFLINFQQLFFSKYCPTSRTKKQRISFNGEWVRFRIRFKGGKDIQKNWRGKEER